MWNVHIKYDHVILSSVTHQKLFYLCYITYDTCSEEDELICNIVRTRYTREIAFR